MWQTRSSLRGRFAPSTLSPRTRIPVHRWGSIHHTERDKVSFLLQQHDRMFAEEFCRGLCDPSHKQPALRTIDRATDLPKRVAASRQSKQECIQTQIELLPLRSDGNDWIATPRPRSMSLRPGRVLPPGGTLICASCSHQMRV